MSAAHAHIPAPKGLKVLLVAPTPPPSGGMALQAQTLARMLKEEGVQVSVVSANPSLPAWLGPLNRIPGVRTVIRTVTFARTLAGCADGGVDVVHIFAASWVYFFSIVYPAIFIGRWKRARVVLNYRGGDAGRFFARFRPVLSKAFRTADVITAPSQFLASLIQKEYHSSVAIVPNILDGSLFQYREPGILRPRILATRHLEKMYDVESVVRAFELIQQRHPDASLTIAGSGSQEHILRAMVLALRLQNVQFIGQVAHADMPGVYKQCDILVNASRVDNFPAALVEASGAGLVIVSTCAGGIPVFYESGKNAMLVEPGDWRGLAAAVEELLEAPDKALRLIRNARSLILSCEWSEVRLALYSAYDIPARQRFCVGQEVN